MAHTSRRKQAFTLVELLVVIGIIAVLIGVLLPTLAKARDSARTVQCASNARQLALAIRLFSQERRGYMPALSDDDHVLAKDPTRSIWMWRASPVDGRPVPLDWASSLLPYLGVRGVEWFPDAPVRASKIFLCPSDRWQDTPGDYGAQNGTDPAGPGLLIYNNVSPPFGGYPISYGVNADIGCQLDAQKPTQGAFGPQNTDTLLVYGGPQRPLTVPLGGKIDRVKRSAEVLLIADCGTRPNSGNPTQGLLRNDALYYTSNQHGSAAGLANLKADAGKLSGVAKFPLQMKRIPWDRHRNKLNIAFVDGHGETIQKGEENKVWITPYSF